MILKRLLPVLLSAAGIANAQTVTIAPGTPPPYQAVGYLTTSGAVTAPAGVCTAFTGGKQVSLEPGFQAVAGATFHAAIAPPLSIVTASLPTGSIGAAYNQTLISAGGKVPYTWVSGSLPAGLNLNGATGVVSGTPTAAFKGTVTFTVIDANCQQVQAALSVTVGAGPTTTTLQSLNNPSVNGQKIVLSAQVTPPTATGLVSFNDGGVFLGTSTINGTAVFEITQPTAGSHPLTASYYGDANDAPSTSAVLTQVVTTSSNSVPVGPSWMSAATFTETYSYHPAGAVVTKRLHVDQQYNAYPDSTFFSHGDFDVNYTYDAAGRVATTQYPANTGAALNPVNYPTATPVPVVYTYGYDTMGRAATLVDNNPLSTSGTGTTWVSGAQYDPGGRLSAWQYYAGTQTPQGFPVDVYRNQANTYNANGQLTAMMWSNQTFNGNQTGWTAPAGLQYNYSATQNNGQIAYMTDMLSGETVNYQYDALKRLVATAADTWSESYQYDGFGNLTGNVLNGMSNPIPVNPATNRLANSFYDGNGNMTTGVGVTFTYDEANRVATASPYSGGTEYYIYGPNNKRVARVPGSSDAGVQRQAEYTMYGAYGEKLGVYTFARMVYPTGDQAYPFQTVGYTNVNFAGQVVRSGGTVPQVDRLGTDRSGGARYRPYGQEITQTSNDRVKFATYTRDGFTGLDYADQRYYANSYGRFNSPDPYKASAGASDPGSWNRYSYVEGDPINFRDPHGLWLEGPDTGFLNCDSTKTGCPGQEQGGSRGGGADQGQGHGGGGSPTDFGNNGPVETQGRAKGKFLHVANPSKAGPHEQRIDTVLDWIKDNADPQCSGWLSGLGDAISGLEGDPANPDSVYIGHGTFDVGVSAFTGSSASQTDLPPGYAITVNDASAFFNSTANGANLSVAGYTGGSSQAQVFILLHEFGHLLGAAGFQSDFGNKLAGNQNDALVKQNCQKTLNAAKNIP